MISCNPLNDFYAWDEYQTQRLERWNAACEKCIICRRPIDPDEDVNSLNFGDEWAHIECFNDKVRESNLPDVLKEYIIESVEEVNYDYTPVPEDI